MLPLGRNQPVAAGSKRPRADIQVELSKLPSAIERRNVGSRWHLTLSNHSLKIMNKIQEVITAACRKLEDTVQDMGVTLKFNISSVSLLEEIILAIKQLGDKSALSGACFMVGSYLGEIFRRELGGEWTAPSEGGRLQAKSNPSPTDVIEII